ncbi:ABC transporter ATP-binding protein [Corynebacterium sp.]|uniref:ABC transporter ATP-binding protein n=1 Tax=Corynebacterium sp. TaxID=1720 RepID=UPI002A914EA4|nr:ABC transporter ATP-binding protein [Corynebacterium sp.]MDY5786225.1 ABC transporter ATP-binding protein [Corynebacterium sp.]
MSMQNVGVQLRDLSVAYGARTVIDVPCLDLAAGKVHGLIGPNGAGKSTLIKAVLGLTKHSGEVLVDGRDMGQLSTKARARVMSYVAQEALDPTPFTGREVVEMGHYSHTGLTAALKVRGVDAALALTGADAWADRPTAATSGGERQLTALSRAFAQDSALMLLDEPLSALDVRHELSVLKALSRWVAENPQRTVVMVLHDLTLAARFCDELVLLAPGERGATVFARGAPEGVLTRDNIQAVFDIDAAVERSPVTHKLIVTPL